METCQFDRPKPTLYVFRKRRKIAELSFDGVWGVVWFWGSHRDNEELETKLAILNVRVQGYQHAK